MGCKSLTVMKMKQWNYFATLVTSSVTSDYCRGSFQLHLGMEEEDLPSPTQSYHYRVNPHPLIFLIYLTSATQDMGGNRDY